MGLLSNLLLFPVTGPIHGVVFVLEQIQEVANAELDEEDHLKERLVALGLSYQSGELQGDAYLTEEEAIFERLDIVYQLSAAQEASESGEEAADFGMPIERRDMDDALGDS